MPRCPANPSGGRPAAAGPPTHPHLPPQRGHAHRGRRRCSPRWRSRRSGCSSNVESSTAGNADVVVEIQQGWTPAQVGDALEQKGVIASSAAFQEVAASAGFIRESAGQLRLRREQRPPRSARHAPRRSAPESPTSSSSCRRGSPSGRSPSASASSRARAPRPSSPPAHSNTVRSRYQPTEVTSLEGLTWPDTYLIGANETETEILQKIVNQFDAEADAFGLAASGPGLTPYPGGHHRVAHRGAKRAEGRRAPDLRGHRQPAQGGHAAADRRHPLLREGRMPAGAHRRRPQDRLALQHLQDRAASPRHRSRR